jgi:hypothetical protein
LRGLSENVGIVVNNALPIVATILVSRNTREDGVVLYLVAIGWMFVVLLMSLAEAMAPNGSALGAAITLVFYGALPLALVLYLLGTPARRRALRAAERASALQPDGGGHAAGDTVAAKREEA